MRPGAVEADPTATAPGIGAWSPGRPGITPEEACDELLRRLLAPLPPPPARILLLGHELGRAAAALAGRGHAVTVATPGGEQWRSLLDGPAPGPGGGGFDAAVLVEVAGSSLPAAPLLQRVRELLAPGGTAIVAGEESTRGAANAGAAAPSADEVTVALAEAGFRPEALEDLSTEVAPTCRVAAERLSAPERAAWVERGEALTSGRRRYQLRVVRSDPHLMRAYRAGDEDEILRMFREVFGVPRTVEHWRWKFRECPYGAGMIAETIGTGGELVAHFGGYPVPFYDAQGGREFLAHQVGDTMTRPSVRQAGLGRHGILARISAYYFARFCRDIPFVYGFNTGHIRKLGERYLGYTYIDPVGCWERAAAAAPAPARPLLRRVLSGYSFAELTEPGGELDALFARARDDYGLLLRRDAGYVGWRYLRCPDRIHRVIAIRHWGRLVGWGAFARRGPVLVWGDALVERRHAAAVAGLLGHCVDGPFRGVERVWGWFSPNPAWWSEVLRGCGFRPAHDPDDLTPCFVFFECPEMKRELAGRWYYTYGDSDLF